MALSCTHAPLTHKPYWDWVLGIIRDFKPDTFIHLGDLYEGKPAKKWPKWSDENWSMVHEHRCVAKQVAQINELVPGKKVWLMGNHDDNIFGNQPDRIADDLKESVHWQHNVDAAPAFKDWKVIPYSERGRFRLGPITFQHGTKATATAEKTQGYLHGVPYGLYIQGHTHRPIQVTQCEERQTPIPYWFANPGCGADWDRMHYMQRCSMGRWGRGAIIGECTVSSVKHRDAAFSSKTWEAELLVHSWAEKVKESANPIAHKYGLR